MSQEQQLQYLYWGLKPTLLQKIYPFHPASTTGFLDLAKLHAEASSLVNRKVLSIAIGRSFGRVSSVDSVFDKSGQLISWINNRSPTNYSTTPSPSDSRFVTRAQLFWCSYL
jgi:hypothetical protein